MTAPLVAFRPPARRADRRVAVTLVTGFLGSGKTTLVNHILANRQDVRAAVLVNELGEIGIDHELIVAADDTMIELSNGCICCSVNGDLVDSIVRVLNRADQLDHIIVETSGVADPLPVALTFQRLEFRRTMRLDAIVAVADAEQFAPERFDSIAARQQLRYADVVLLNKCDTVDNARLLAVESLIRALNPDTKIARTVRCAVPLPLILAIDLDHIRQIDAQPVEPAHMSHDGFTSLCFVSDRPFSVHRFQAFLDTGRPAGLFRAKGFLFFAETTTRYSFHLVGDRFALDADENRDRSANRLVLIGRDLDSQALLATLTACLVPEPAETVAG